MLKGLSELIEQILENKGNTIKIILLLAVLGVGIFFVINMLRLEGDLDRTSQKFRDFQQIVEDKHEASTDRIIDYWILQSEQNANEANTLIAINNSLRQELYACMAKLHARSIIDRKFPDDDQAGVIREIDEIIGEDANDVFKNKEKN